MNVVVLAGRLTDDPSTHEFESGKRKAEFSVATNEWRGGQKATEYHDCVAWDKTAEIVEKHLTKGRFVVVIGRKTTRTYTNRSNQEVRKAEIVVNSIEFGDSPSGESNAPRAARPRQQQAALDEADPELGW